MLRAYGDPDCAVARALEVLGDGWTVLVLRECFVGTRRFADFEAALTISKNILASRLAHLVEHGVLEKVDAGRYGERYEYQLTDKGREMITVLTALRQWAERWVFGKGREPLVVIDRKTGRPIERMRVRRADGSAVALKDMVLQPGPGASAATRARWGRRESEER